MTGDGSTSFYDYKDDYISSTWLQGVEPAQGEGSVLHGKESTPVVDLVAVLVRQTASPKFRGFTAGGEQASEAWHTVTEDHIMAV